MAYQRLIREKPIGNEWISEELLQWNIDKSKMRVNGRDSETQTSDEIKSKRGISSGHKSSNQLKLLSTPQSMTLFCRRTSFFLYIYNDFFFKWLVKSEDEGFGLSNLNKHVKLAGQKLGSICLKD